MTKPVLRLATEDDIDVLIAVKDAATEGWEPEADPADPERLDGQRRIFRHLLSTGTTIAACLDDVPIGFGSAIVREDVWFLSQLFVRPDVQSAGSGAATLDALLARPEATGARVRCVVSSTDPRAYGLYLSRGMLPGWQMVQFVRRGTAPDRASADGVFEPLEAGDQGAVDELDRAVRGFARTVDHALLGELAQGHALRRDGRLAAYAYVQPSGRVGPLVAADDRSLVAAIDAADALAGPEASWSVATSAPLVVQRLLERGYRPGWISTFCADGPVGPFDRVALAGGAVL